MAPPDMVPEMMPDMACAALGRPPPEGGRRNGMTDVMFLRPVAALSLAGLMLAGCTNPQAVAPVGVRVVGANQVAGCSYVMNFSEKPALYGVLAAEAQAYARRSILQAAARAGANTVVFDRVEPGAMVTEIKATAFRC